ncbi:hypothetical protein EVAR_56298_1 [Eumeta japonica]|uniref:Uncharacterized protein n=1 Tax=Eumeta variegata TaxID=151549 RepID=A0A4C1Z0G7_EUMVA|nr:hypothetical protein EVAR_56298_1 [Eumeta japonica]
MGYSDRVLSIGSFAPLPLENTMRKKRDLNYQNYEVNFCPRLVKANPRPCFGDRIKLSSLNLSPHEHRRSSAAPNPLRACMEGLVSESSFRE